MRPPYTRRSLLFIGLILLILALSQTTIHLYHADHQEDRVKVSLAGRQRAFLQEMVKNSLLLQQENSVGGQEVRHELELLYQKWENTHRALEYGNEAYMVSGNNSEEIQKLFQEIESSYSGVKTSVAAFLSNNPEITINDFLAFEKEYDHIISQIIFQYAREANSAESTFIILELSFAILMLIGVVAGYFLILRPTSKRLEQQTNELLELNKELQGAGKVKARFLANLSHEIQTPLQGVLGLSGLLKSKNLDKDSYSAVLALDESAEKLNTVVGSMMDYSLIESGMMKLNLDEFALNKSVEEVCHSFRAAAREKSIELNINLSPDLPGAIVQDKARFQQILLNLLSNSVKFTERGDIELIGELINTEQEFAHLKFTVRDTGSGIGFKELESLQKTLSGNDSEDELVNDNIGMGLAICKDLVKLMGGQMSVEKTPGGGTTFSFTIVAEIGSNENRVDFDMKGLEGKKAIVVDDNKTNLKVLVRMLATWGMRATPFNSPDLVRDTLESIAKFDFVIVDLQMPELDGRELAMSIRSKLGPSETKIIALITTADEVVRDGDDLFDALIQKPVKQETMLRTLLRLVVSEDEPDEQGRTQMRLPGNYRKIKVLIAEGNPLHQAVSKKILDRMGMASEKVTTDKELFFKLQSDEFDLVLMDDELNAGNDAIGRMRDLYENEDEIPLVFGVKSSKPESNNLSSGADDMLNEISVEELSNKVFHWFSDD